MAQFGMLDIIGLSVKVDDQCTPLYLYICVFVTCVLVYLCIFICTLLRYIKYIVLGLNIYDKQQMAQRQAAWVSKVVAQSFGHNFPVLPMDTVK